MPEYTQEKATVDSSIMFTLSYRAESGCQGDKDKEEEGKETVEAGANSICKDEQ